MKRYRTVGADILSLSVLAFTPLLLPEAFPWLCILVPAYLLSRRFSENLEERVIATFILIPTINSIILLPFSIIGGLNGILLLAILVVVAVASLVHGQGDGAETLRLVSADDESGRGIGISKTGPWAGMACFAAMLVPAWFSVANPGQAIWYGHAWSIHDGGRFFAGKGIFPWLSPIQIGHHNDHLFYNPAATFLSAVCYRLCPSVGEPEIAANLLPSLYTFATVVAVGAFSRFFLCSAIPGFLGYAMLLGCRRYWASCFTISHDTLTPFFTLAVSLAGLKWIAANDRRQGAIFLFGLVGAGFVRPYLGAMLLAAIVLTAGVSQVPPGSKAVALVEAVRRARGALFPWFLVTMLLMLSWNIVLAVKYRSPVYPFHAGLFGNPPGISAADLKILSVFADTNPGYLYEGGDHLSKLRWMTGLNDFFPGSASDLRAWFQGELLCPAHVVLIGVAVILSLLPRSKRVFGNVIPLIVFAFAPLLFWLVAGPKNASHKLLVPSAVPLSALAAYPIFAMLRWVSIRINAEKPESAEAFQQVSSAVALVVVAVCCLWPLGPYVQFIRDVRLFHEDEALKYSAPENWAMGEALRRTLAPGENVLIAPWSEKGALAFFLFRERPYWEYAHYQSPETYDLHAAAKPDEVFAALKRMNIRYVLAKDPSDNDWPCFRKTFTDRGMAELFPVMLFRDERHFRRLPACPPQTGYSLYEVIYP
ncbi:MAG TPA: hypothetical protein PL033_18135 [Candidatus Brocadiia bacterium]|nr:hypothetical protein [Candidatus Brocadiia bacterium]